MKQIKISLASVLIITLVIAGCQKDDMSSDQHSQTSQQYTTVDKVDLILNPSKIPHLQGNMPSFDLNQFKANHQPINIFEKFDIEAEDMSDLSIPTKEEFMASSRSVVYLPDGSIDGLADAIADAGTNGLVIVETGTHTESSRVVISNRVTILGQPGAVIESSVTGFVPALHINGTTHVNIIGLEMHSMAASGYGMLIENADKTDITGNTFLGYDLSIMVEQSNHCKIYMNTVAGSGLSHCFVNMNGDKNKVYGNEFTNGRFGAWLCDEDGKYRYNTTDDNFIGVIFCKVPAGFPLPDGGTTGAENSSTNWNAKFNTSNDNVREGYLAIDGANNNTIKFCSSSGNGTYSVELVGDSYRFGFYTPPSFENTVTAYDDMTVKDCGIDNTVIGGIPIDIGSDPCY